MGPPSLASPRLRSRLEARGTYRRWVLISALAGMFATTFPVTILSVSLADIADELGSSTRTLTWVIAAPMLLSAVTLPVLGKLGDLYGHRKVYLRGFALAVVVSAATAAAWDPLSLIGLRSAAQVIGGATQPTSMALVMLVFPRSERVRAVGWWSLVAAGAPAVGLAVGGPLVDLFGWRPIFVIQSVLALGALLLATLVLPESEPRPVRFDLAGSATLLVAVGGVMFAIGQARTWGPVHPAVVAAAVASVPAAAAFVAVERRSPHPLLPLELLRVRNVSAAFGTNLFQGAVYMGGFVLAPLALRDLFGLSATVTAAVMLLRTGVYSLSSPLGGRLGARWGTRRAATAGTSLLTAAMVVFIVGTAASAVAVFAAGLVVQGLGNGITRPPVTAALANAVPEDHLGLVSAFQRMVHQIGSSFGLTVLSAAYDGSARPGSFAVPFAVGAALGVVAVALASLLRPDADRAAPEPVPALAGT